MATTKITELTAYTNPATTDVLPIVDVAADSTKKIEVQNLLAGAGSGTEAAPAIAFASDSDTGIYRPGADQIAISAGGTNQVTVDNTGVTIPEKIIHSGDADTYISFINDDEFAVTAGGTEYIRVLGAGSVILGGQVSIQERIKHENDTNTWFGFPTIDTFTVTTNGSERIRVLSTGGLTFNGDTQAANALDDYEEGTFIPHIVGTTSTGTATYTSRTGVYTKVGNQVSFALEMTWTFLNGIGAMKVTGLPYDSKSGIDQPVSALSDNLNLNQGLNAPALTFHAMVLPNSDEIKLYKCQVSATATDDITIDGAATVYLAGTYLAST
jgi:hypothetical protein